MGLPYPIIPIFTLNPNYKVDILANGNVRVKRLILKICS